MIKVVFLLAVVFLASGCPYTMSARHPVAFNSIAVLPFENRTTELLSGHEITKTIKQELVRRTSARLSSDSNASVVLKGSIFKISRDIISEDNTGAVVSERINLQVKIELKTGSRSENFTVIGTAVYEKINLVSRDLLIREALHDAARRITDRLIHLETPVDV